jgi:Ca2+:H+ antiporter
MPTGGPGIRARLRRANVAEPTFYRDDQWMSEAVSVSPPVEPAGRGGTFIRSDLIIFAAAALAIAAAAITFYAKANSVLGFACSAVAVALLAALVGRSVEQLGDRLGAGGTGVLQSALGNLPELFIAFFALRAGLLVVVQAAIIGSMLANLLFVLGLAFIVGGLRNGNQKFGKGPARDTCVLLALATAALVLPSMAQYTHSPAAPHVRVLSDAVAVVLLVIFALSLPAALRRTEGGGEPAGETGEPARWPLWLAIGMLALSGVTSALVSDWFVVALQPAIKTLHLSQAFAGLVVVAIAGNAIENVVGIQLAYRNKTDYALSVIINSPLQIALVLAPALVLLSLFTATTLTLVFAPMLVAAVVVTVLIVSLIVFDGESNWLEGATLVGLYVIVAAVFWWG